MKRIVVILGVGVIILCGLLFLITVLFSPKDSDGEVTTEVAAVATVRGSDLSVEEETGDEPASGDAEAEESSSVSDATSAPESTVAPEPTSTPLPPPTPTPPPVGMSRSVPFAQDELVNGPNWDIQVLEVVRGEEAWSRIHAANSFYEPPSESMEYVIIRVFARSTYVDGEAHTISAADFKVTGDRLIEYSYSSAAPEPELDAELLPGGETEGWIAFEVGQGEEQLILVMDELLNFADDRFRYIALDEGASISIDEALYSIRPSEAGLGRVDPLGLGETAVTEDWEITINEVIRGNEAWTMTQAANQFNEPPAEGMEYVAINITARNIGTREIAQSMDGSYFNSTGDRNILYDNPSVVDPEPSLDVRLYPGGEYTGWIIVEAAVDESNLMLVFSPWFDFTGDETRYLALEDGASITVPDELADVESNDLGEERTAPAALGDTVIVGGWELTVVDVVRGNDALAMIEAANQFNDPPEPGMEYLLVKVRARNVSQEDTPDRISDISFETVGDGNTQHDLPSVVEPEPALDVNLYPAGEYEGWIAVQSEEGETGLVLVYEPPFSFTTRYFAIE